MFVRFKETKDSKNGRPLYDVVVLHNSKRYVFQEYCPSFSAYDKNSHEARRKAMRQEIVDFFEQSPSLFVEI